MNAVKAVLSDDGFKFPSPPAKEALCIAEKLAPWCDDATNKECLATFVSKLYAVFDRCINCSTRKLSHPKLMERIWGTFHAERC